MKMEEGKRKVERITYAGDGVDVVLRAIREQFMQIL